MDFSEALAAAKNGKRVKRTVWTTVFSGMWMEYALLHADGSGHAEPALIVHYQDDEVWHLFAGANWDLMADDWELLP